MIFNGRADSNPRLASNIYTAAKSHARTDMHAISNYTIVFDNRTAVHDHVLSNEGVGVDDRSSHYNAAGTDSHRLSDRSCWMN